jgi:hypothetical protein
VAVTAVLGLLLVGPVVKHQVDVSMDSQEAWEVSYDEQGDTMRGVVEALEQVPRDDAQIITFGHPIWERGYVPVFSAGWDMLGAIDLRTEHEPRVAIPWLPGTSCDASGVVNGASKIAPFANGPVFFINAGGHTAQRIETSAECNRVAEKWGPPPYWGRLVTGG